MDAAIDTAAHAPRLLDEREFHVLYARTAAPLRAFVARTLGSASHADDIVQETFLRVLRRPVPVLGDDKLRAYVFRIAGNLVVDHWRTRKREATGDIPERGAPGRDQALRMDMGRIFARLKPRERQLVWLAHVEGAAHHEIASAMGLAREASASCSRARAIASPAC